MSVTPIKVIKVFLCILFVVAIILPLPLWGGYPPASEVGDQLAKNYAGLVSYKVRIDLSHPLEGWSILYWQEGGKYRIEIIFSRDNSTIPCMVKLGNGVPWDFFSLEDLVSPYKVWGNMGIDLSKEQYLFFRHIPVLNLGGTNSTEASVSVDIENMVLIKKTYRGGRNIIFEDYLNEGNYPLPSGFEITMPGLSSLRGNFLWKSINEKIPPRIFKGRRGTFLFPIEEDLKSGLNLLLRYFPSLIK